MTLTQEAKISRGNSNFELSLEVQLEKSLPFWTERNKRLNLLTYSMEQGPS